MMKWMCDLCEGDNDVRSAFELPIWSVNLECEPIPSRRQIDLCEDCQKKIADFIDKEIKDNEKINTGCDICGSDKNVRGGWICPINMTEENRRYDNICLDLCEDCRNKLADFIGKELKNNE